MVTILTIVMIFVFKDSAPAVEYTTDTVKMGDLKQTVEATGSIDPAREIDLNFEITGTVATVSVVVGEKVVQGQTLMILDTSDLNLQVAQAEANLAQAQALLNQSLAGLRDEEINISEQSLVKARLDYENASESLTRLQTELDKQVATSLSSLNKARADLANAEQNLQDVSTLQEQNIKNLNSSALTSLDKALADADIALHEVEKIADENDYEDYLGVKNTGSQIAERKTRARAEQSLEQANVAYEVAKNDLDDQNLDNALTAGITALDDMFDELKKFYTVLVNTTTSINNLPESTLNGLKTNISNQQISISAALNSVKSADQALKNGRINQNSAINTASANLDSAENYLAIAEANYQLALAGRETQLLTAENNLQAGQAGININEAELGLKTADPREVDIAAKRAQVNQARAARDLTLNNLNHAYLKAPMDGTITKINYEQGEQLNAKITTSLTALSMVSLDNFEINVDISETDIAKIELNDIVDIDFDAFGDDFVYAGTVINIDPAQTVIQDVIYYQVKIKPDNKINGVKPGMTANVTIHTDERKDALHVPRRAVIEKNGKKWVKLFQMGSPEEVEVTTGLRADDGLVEITSGLEQGQRIVTYEKNLD